MCGCFYPQQLAHRSAKWRIFRCSAHFWSICKLLPFCTFFPVFARFRSFPAGRRGYMYPYAAAGSFLPTLALAAAPLLAVSLYYRLQHRLCCTGYGTLNGCGMIWNHGVL